MPPRRRSAPELPSESQQQPFAPIEPGLDDPDPTDRLAEEMNDPNTVDLSEHDPGVIHGHTQMPFGAPTSWQPNVFESAPMQGRPTSPPLWKSAQMHANVTQLRVWRRENGVPVSVGTVDARVSEEEFIAHFAHLMPLPGEPPAQFEIRPLDISGSEIDRQIILPPISPGHIVLVRRRAQAAAGVAAGGGAAQPAAPDMTPFTRIIEQTLAMQKDALSSKEQALEEERQRLAEERTRGAEDRISLASQTGRTVEALAERAMQTEQARNDAMLRMSQESNSMLRDATANLFTQLHLAQVQAAEREREANNARLREESERRERERRDAEERRRADIAEQEERRRREREEAERKERALEAEFERKRQRDQEEAERRERRDREDAERRERERIDRLEREDKERQRQAELRAKELELAAQREREHAQRMLELSLRRDKSDSLEGVLEKGTGILEKLGVKPADLISKFFRDDAESAAAATAGAETTGVIAEVVGRVLESGIKAAGEIFASRNKARAAGPVAYPPNLGGFPALPMAPDGTHISTGARTPEPVTVTQVPNSAPAAATSASTTPPPEPPPSKDLTSSLPLLTQRDARRAVRAVCEKLRTKPQEEWLDTVMFAVTSEPAILAYAKEQGIRPILREGGADEATITAFMSHSACAFIPDDIPRG